MIPELDNIIYCMHMKTYSLKSHVMNFVMQMSLSESETPTCVFTCKEKCLPSLNKEGCFSRVKKVMKGVCREWIGIASYNHIFTLR